MIIQNIMDTYCKESEVEFMSINYETIHRDSDINRMYSNRSRNNYTLANPDGYSTTTIDIDQVSNRNTNSNSASAVSRELARGTSKARECTSNAYRNYLLSNDSLNMTSTSQPSNKYQSNAGSDLLQQTSSNQGSNITPNVSRDPYLKRFPEVRDKGSKRFSSMSRNQTSKHVPVALWDHHLERAAPLSRDQSVNRFPNLSSDKSLNTIRVLGNQSRTRTSYLSKESSSKNHDLARDTILKRDPDLLRDQSMQRCAIPNDHSSKIYPEFSREQTLNRVFSSSKDQRSKRKESSTPTMSCSVNQPTGNTFIDPSKKHHLSNRVTPDSPRVTNLVKTSTSDMNLPRATQKTSRQVEICRPRLCRSDKSININVVQQNVAKGVMHSLKLARSGSDSSVDITIMTPHPHSQNQEEYRIIQPKRRIKVDTNSIIEQKKIEATDVIQEKWEQILNTVQKLSRADVANESVGLNPDRLVVNSMGSMGVSARVNECREKSKRNNINKGSKDSVTQDDVKLNCVEAKKMRIMLDDVHKFPLDQDQHNKAMVRLVLWPSEERKIKTERAKKLLKDSRRKRDEKCLRNAGNMIQALDKTTEINQINRIRKVDSADKTLKNILHIREWPSPGDVSSSKKKEPEQNVATIHKNKKTLLSNGYKCTTGIPKTNEADGTTVINFNLRLPSGASQCFKNLPEKINRKMLAKLSFAPKTTISGLNCEPNFGKAMEYRWNSKTSAEQLEERCSAKARRKLEDGTREKELPKEHIYNNLSSSDLTFNVDATKREIYLTESPKKEMNSVQNVRQDTKVSCNEPEREITLEKGSRVKSIMAEKQSKTRCEIEKAFYQKVKKNMKYGSDSQRCTNTPRPYTTESESDVTESTGSSLSNLQSRIHLMVKEHERQLKWQPRNSFQAADHRVVREDCQTRTQENTGVERCEENSSEMVRPSPRSTENSPPIAEYLKPRLADTYHDKQLTPRSSIAYRPTDSSYRLPKQIRDNIQALKEVKGKHSALEALENYLAKHSFKSLDRRSTTSLANEEKCRKSVDTTRAMREVNRRSSMKPDASYGKVEYASDSSMSTLVDGNDNMETDKNYVLFHLSSTLSMLGDGSMATGQNGNMLTSESLIPAKNLEKKLSKLREISHKNSIIFKEGNDLSEMHAEKECSTCYLGCCEPTMHAKERKSKHRHRSEDDADMKNNVGLSPPTTESRMRRREQGYHESREIQLENIEKPHRQSVNKMEGIHSNSGRHSRISIPTHQSSASSLSEHSYKDEYYDPSYRSHNQKCSNSLSKVPDKLVSEKYSRSKRSLTAHQSVESGDVWLMDERDFTPDTDLNPSSKRIEYQRSRCGEERYSLKPQLDRPARFLVSERDTDTSETDSTISRISIIAAPFSHHGDLESRDVVPQHANRMSSYQFTFSNPNIKSWRESCPESPSLFSSSTRKFDTNENCGRVNVEKQTFHSQTGKEVRGVRSKDDKVNKRDEKLGMIEKKSRTFSETELKRMEKSKMRNTNEEEVSRKTRHTIRDASKDVSGGENEVKQGCYERDHNKRWRSDQPEDKRIEVIKTIKGNRIESNKEKRRRKKYENSREREHGDTAGKMNDIDGNDMISGQSMIYQVMRAECLNKIEDNPDVRRIDKKIAMLEKDLAALSEMTFHCQQDSYEEISGSETDSSTSAEISCFQQRTAVNKEALRVADDKSSFQRTKCRDKQQLLDSLSSDYSQ